MVMSEETKYAYKGVHKLFSLRSDIMWWLMMMKELLIVVISWIDEYPMRWDIDVDVDADADAWMIIENCMYNYVKCYN